MYTVECRYNAVQFILYIIYSYTMAAVEYKPDFELTEDTPYLTLMGELLVMCCEDFGENLSRYNGTDL